MNRSTLIVGLAATLAGLAPAAAQDYPSRPIHALTATSAGGTSDVFLRVIGDEMHKKWGQPLIVENRPGGGLNIGGRACAEAANDGYTICMLPAETLAYNQFLFKKLNFDPTKDFAPITNPFFNTQALVVTSALGVKTVDELAALAKARPATLSYFAPSVPLALFMDRFNRERGIDLVRIPFKGGGDSVNAVLSGATPVAFLGLGNFIAYIRSGMMTAIAVDGTTRSPLLPDVPTLAELGYRGELTRVYFGIVAPAGTPAPIIAKVRDEIARIGAIPEFRQKRLIEQGLEPVFDTPAEFARFLAEDRAVSERVVRESGLEMH